MGLYGHTIVLNIVLLWGKSIADRIRNAKVFPFHDVIVSHVHGLWHFEGILPKGPYPSCLRMADKALLAGYPRFQVLKNSSFYVSRLPDDDSIQAISFFTTVRVAAGWRCQTDFYCPRTEQNPKILVAHVLRHLEELMSLKEDVYIFLPTSYSTSYPGDVSKALLLKHLKGLEARGGSCELPDLLVSMNVADIEEYWKTNRWLWYLHIVQICSPMNFAWQTKRGYNKRVASYS